MDTKKYIIEIPDNTAWLQWVKVSDKDGHVCFDFKYPEDLTPYTEPDTEQVREDAFKNGYDAACKDIDVKSKTNAAYRKGLEDAWNAARKFMSEVIDSRFRNNFMVEIFECDNAKGAMKVYSASECIEKIRQYEHEQEEQIQVGDEVIGIYSSGEQTNPFVITKGNSDYYFGIYSGSGEFCQGGLKLQKTGRHFPEIAEVLRKMQEEKE